MEISVGDLVDLCKRLRYGRRGGTKGVKGLIAVIVLGVAFLAFSIAAITVPRAALLRAAGIAEHHVEALMRVGEAAVESAGEVARRLWGHVERLLETGAAPRSTISGSPTVFDGDTLKIGAHWIRLHGIDAPEGAQICRADGARWRCGERAAHALAKRIGGRPVACEERDRDRYGRIVALCRAGGEDLNAWMVERGWALAYRRFSRAYVDEERTARAARRGIWRGDFVAPWDWRDGERLAGTAAARTRDVQAGAGGCRIKGNIRKDGRRIYHVPGGAFYERARVEPAKGEQWFCTESEARAAGWRRSKR